MNNITDIMNNIDTNNLNNFFANTNPKINNETNIIIPIKVK